MIIKKKKDYLSFNSLTKLLGNIEQQDRTALKKCLFVFSAFVAFSMTPFWCTVATGIAINCGSCLWDISQIEIKQLVYIVNIISICVMAKTLGAKSLSFYN